KQNVCRGLVDRSPNSWSPRTEPRTRVPLSGTRGLATRSRGRAPALDRVGTGGWWASSMGRWPTLGFPECTPPIWVANYVQEQTHDTPCHHHHVHALGRASGE